MAKASQPDRDTPRARDRSDAAREGMAAARARGVTLGRPRQMPPSAPMVKALLKKGLSYQQAADQLNADNVPTAKGGPWTRAAVQNVAVKLGLAASPRVRAPKAD